MLDAGWSPRAKLVDVGFVVQAAAAGVLATGCQFSSPTGASNPDAPDVDEPRTDAPAVDAPDAGTFVCGGTTRRWSADFSADPTTLDTDGDATLDWVIRGGGSFPAAELSGGRWIANPSPALDTRPKRDFRGRTAADLRIRATAEGGTGATFWINVDFEGGDFAPLWVTSQLVSGTQTLVLHNKTPTSNDVTLASMTGLGTGLLDIHLDIDPGASTVALVVDTVMMAPVTFSRIPAAGNDDRFGTVIPYGTPSEFDTISIKTCE